MTDTLRIIHAVAEHDGVTYTASRGPIPETVPAAVVKEWRDAGYLAGDGEDVFDSPGAADPTATQTGGAEGEPAPSGSGGGGSGAELPDGAPDAADASVADLARYIDSENLNASQTVALAKGDPALASKVLEAEQTASGGDGRKTVVEPLSKLADSAG